MRVLSSYQTENMTWAGGTGGGGSVSPAGRTSRHCPSSLSSARPAGGAPGGRHSSRPGRTSQLAGVFSSPSARTCPGLCSVLMRRESWEPGSPPTWESPDSYSLYLQALSVGQVHYKVLLAGVGQAMRRLFTWNHHHEGQYFNCNSRRFARCKSIEVSIHIDNAWHSKYG